MPKINDSDLIGKTEKDAEQYIKKKNLIFCIQMRDGVELYWNEKHNYRRVRLSIENGIVKSIIGIG